MKCLITDNSDGIIMDNIVMVEWLSTNDLPKELKADVFQEAVVVATDVNRNVTVLGEFLTKGYAMAAVEDILKWLADPHCFDIYYIYPTVDGAVSDHSAPQYDYPYYYESYLKNNKVDIDNTDDLEKNCLDQSNMQNAEDIMSLDIGDVRPYFSARTYTLLRCKAHCKTVQDIINYPPNELKNIKGLGKGMYNEIIDRLKDLGINTEEY